MAKKKSKTDSSDGAANTSTSSFGQQIPPPPPPPTEEPPTIVPDVGLGISPSLHARYDKIRAEKKAPTAARITRPGISGAKYQRAQSARVLPTAPPPPPPPSAVEFGNKSIAAIGGGKGLSMSMHTPAASSRSLGRASSARLMSPTPPPPPYFAPPPPPPPPIMEPEDLLLAEGVPLTAGKAALPTLSESASGGMDAGATPTKGDVEKPKKKKKKEEKPSETFEDELEDVSESEAEEELSAEEKAEKKEQEVRKTLCFALLNACGLIFLIMLISKLCQRFSNAEYTGEDEFLNAAGTNVGAPVPPPPGVEAAVNVGVAQNMAVAASQGAAASTAAGTTSAATVAAAAASTAAITSVSSTASLVGVSAVTVTGVGMAAGVVPVPSFMLGSQHPCHVFLDQLAPHRGFVNLHVKNLPENFFNVPANTPSIETAFTEAFNKVLGTCVAHSIQGHNDTDTNSTEAGEIPQDVYARFLQDATLDAWDFWSVVDNETGKRVKYFTTEWVAFVGCDDKDGESVGCSSLEPLFYNDDLELSQDPSLEANTTRRQLRVTDPYARWLEDTSLMQGQNQSNLKLFMESFSLELQGLLALTPSSDDLDPKVFYGASLATNDTHRIVESEGEKYQNGHLLAGKGSGGAVDRPHGLPICSLPNGNPIATLELKEGHVQLGLLGVDEAFFTNDEQLMRDTFRSVYNDLMLGCEGEYSRVMEKVELSSMSGRVEQGQALLSTNWSCLVSCDGCPDIEPLFTMGASRGNSGKQGGGRQLELRSESQLAKFANALAAEISRLHQTKKPGSVVEAYYAASVDEMGAVVGDAEGEIQPFASKHGGLVDCATMQRPGNVDDLPEGRFELYIKDLVKDMNKDILAAAMRDVYNEVTGMCDGPLQRVAHRVTVDDLKQVIIDDSQVFVAMNMTAKLTCTRCDGIDEMMFGGGDQGAASRRLQQTAAQALFERFKSKLTTQINLLITDYEQTPYYEEGVPLFGSTDPAAPHKQVEVVYGATFDRSGSVTRYGTPVHSHNIFALTEELLAGTDVIVDVQICEADLVKADVNRDHGLTQEEYFSFVRSLFDLVAPSMTWHSDVTGYDGLPEEAQKNFGKFQRGGIMQFGAKDVADAANEERRMVHVAAICYFTSHAVKDYVIGGTLEPTEAPTLAPSTSSPTVVPTISPTSEFPSERPSEAPTETRVVEINVEWRLKMDPDNRDASEQEYLDFADRASGWISHTMQDAYALNSTYSFESQTTKFTTSQYEAPTAEKDYSIVAITVSDFIFRGTQPTERSVFELLSQQNLTNFVENYLWVLEESEDPWIFDLVVGLTVATAQDT